MGDEGVDVALLFCEYSPKATGYQLFDDLLPLVEHNPRRFRPVANVNPHLHFPIARELVRQLDHGAAALKIHPVHGGFRADDAALYPAYSVLVERGVPLVVHSRDEQLPRLDQRLRRPDAPGRRPAGLPGPAGRAGPRRPRLVVRRGGLPGHVPAQRLDRAVRPAAQAAARVLRPLRPRPAGPQVDLRHGLARRARAGGQRPRGRRRWVCPTTSSRWSSAATRCGSTPDSTPPDRAARLSPWSGRSAGRWPSGGPARR